MMTARECVILCLLTGVFGCSDTQQDDIGSSPLKDEASNDVWFTDEAKERGLVFQYASGNAGRPLMPEIVGGGVAVLDVNNDGKMDIYLVQADFNLERGAPDQGSPSRLFVNQGEGYFEQQSNTGAEVRGYGLGVATGDFNNDGNVDIYVANLGRNHLLKGDGTGTFVDVTEKTMTGDDGFSTAAMFHDWDRDGDLDLYVVNYLNWSLTNERVCETRGKPTYCSPRAYAAPAVDRLYRNDGDGGFTDVSLSSGIATAPANGMAVVSEDFDGDGWQDIFVTNDLMGDQLWLNQCEEVPCKQLRFREVAGDFGVAVDDNGVAKAGMGVVSPDVDQDGDPDLLIVNMQTQTDSFFRNEGTYFVDVTSRFGLAAISRKRTRFGVVAADFNNDGVVDLFEANGRVDGNPADPGNPFAEDNVLMTGTHNASGEFRFVEVARGHDRSKHTSRGLAMGDFDDDGGIDLVVVNRDGPVQLLMNHAGRDRDWVRLRLLTVDGRDAHGAEVTLARKDETRYGRVQVAASYAAAHDPRVHFGLGARPGAGQGASSELVFEIHWPDAQRQQIRLKGSGVDHTIVQKAAASTAP
ncbi:MAG: CRTAC1 family protein, partial [Pseudomonadota bacterium]